MNLVLFNNVKLATRMLFDLDKVTVESFGELLRELKPHSIDFRIITDMQELRSTHLNGQDKLQPDQLIELCPRQTCRVGKEIWHKGDTIKRPISDLIDLITHHAYVECNSRYKFN
jgi:hypothetical protein